MPYSPGEPTYRLIQLKTQVVNSFIEVNSIVHQVFKFYPDLTPIEMRVIADGIDAAAEVRAAELRGELERKKVPTV